MIEKANFEQAAARSAIYLSENVVVESNWAFITERLSGRVREAAFAAFGAPERGESNAKERLTSVERVMQCGVLGTVHVR
jgi:hypothetical protein